MMKLKTQTWLLLLCIFACMPSSGTALTVSGVTVSATAESPEAARTQALDKAHRLAFEKLKEEYYPESTRPIPPEETLKDMVKDFSPDVEKPSMDNKTYNASLTFTFDDGRIHDWFQEERVPSNLDSPGSPQARMQEPLKISVTYASLGEWNRIKQAIEALPGGREMAVISFTAETAEIELPYGGDGAQLQRGLENHGVQLAFQQGKWVIPADAVALSMEVY